MTKSQRKALEILRDHGPILPAAFAEKMWPDSPCWNRSYKCGAYGSHRGGAMYRAAGGFLGKLRKKGWALQRESILGGWNVGYIISIKGKKALEASEK
jgi:hypothetical protein